MKNNKMGLLIVMLLTENQVVLIMSKTSCAKTLWSFLASIGSSFNEVPRIFEFFTRLLSKDDYASDPTNIDQLLSGTEGLQTLGDFPRRHSHTGKKNSAHILYVDYKKAYDSILHSYLIEIPRSYKAN